MGISKMPKNVFASPRPSLRPASSAKLDEADKPKITAPTKSQLLTLPFVMFTQSFLLYVEPVTQTNMAHGSVNGKFRARREGLVQVEMLNQSRKQKRLTPKNQPPLVGAEEIGCYLEELMSFARSFCSLFGNALSFQPPGLAKSSSTSPFAPAYLLGCSVTPSGLTIVGVMKISRLRFVFS